MDIEQRSKDLAVIVALSGVLDRPVTTYPVPHRATLDQREIDQALAPVLGLDERPDREALTRAIVPFVSALVTLSEAEREYAERLQWGEFVPELVLEKQPELLERARRHPGLLWKAENGRRRARR